MTYLPPGKPVPYRWIEGLPRVAQNQIERDFEAIQMQLGEKTTGILFVAPSDASTYDQGRADLVLTGTSDEIALNALLETHQDDYMAYGFFAGTVLPTGTINPNGYPAELFGVVAPQLLSESGFDIARGATINGGTRFQFATGGTYTSVEDVPPYLYVDCMFGINEGRIRNFVLVGTSNSSVGCVANVLGESLQGSKVELSELLLENVQFLTGGGDPIGAVFRNIINCTPHSPVG